MVAAIPLAFIIPAMCYIRLEDGPLLSRKKAPAVILALFGTIVTIFGTIIIILKVTKRTVYYSKICKNCKKIMNNHFSQNKNLQKNAI